MLAPECSASAIVKRIRREGITRPVVALADATQVLPPATQNTTIGIAVSRNCRVRLTQTQTSRGTRYMVTCRGENANEGVGGFTRQALPVRCGE